MAYPCPRCGTPVNRGGSTAAGVAGGAVGALIASAFSGFHCPKCGPIAKSEFPPDVQSKMTFGSIAMVGIAVVLLVVVIGLIVFIQSR